MTKPKLPKILDCTLRDGGYYTNWDFDEQVVNTYLRSVEQLPIDVLEVGYRSNPKGAYVGKYFYSPIKTLQALKRHTTKQIAIILDEKDVKREDVSDLLRPCGDLIDMVRVAVNPKNFKRAIGLAEEIKSLGYTVSFNVMYMSSWKEEQDFIDSIHLVGDKVDYFYMVDSYGGVYPEDVRENYQLIRDRCDVKIGFHGHNNLELALINTLTAIECGVDIIDATITGMGRGAGNLKTELLLTTLNSKEYFDLNYNALSEVVETFESIQKQYGWGTNLAYMVSGVTSSPQKDVMEWVTKYMFSFNSVIQAMDNRRHGREDNQKLSLFKPERQYEEALIIGGGSNAVLHADAVRDFVEGREDKVCLIHASSKNASHFADLPVRQYFCLVGNEGQRLENIFRGNMRQFTGVCVLPPYPRDMGTYIPPSVQEKSYELERIAFLDDSHGDSLTATALQCAVDLGARVAYFAGYDGYSDGSISQRERELFLENEQIFEAASRGGLECKTLLPTKYEGLKSDSVYAWI
jgi:4-hydroxy 2-oxovalerate aldolase